jgi:hypothetical protein
MACLCYLIAVLIQDDMGSCDQAVGDADRDTAGHMVVARSGVPERFPAPPMTTMARRSVLGHDHKPFQHLADKRRGEPEIAMPPLPFEREQSGVTELGEMPARGLW